MPAWLKIGGWSVAGFLALLAASNLPVRSELGHSCVICRLNRVDSTLFHFTRSAYQPTECSRWYAEHVEPSHAHAWGRWPCGRVENLLGGRMGFRCGFGHPIHTLPSHSQMRVYQHFEDPLEAKRLFEGLAARPRDGRADERGVGHARNVVEALMVWETRGFPGNWDEWWAGFLAKPPEQRSDYAYWLISDPGIDFDEWRRREETRAN